MGIISWGLLTFVFGVSHLDWCQFGLWFGIGVWILGFIIMICDLEIFINIASGHRQICPGNHARVPDPTGLPLVCSRIVHRLGLGTRIFKQFLILYRAKFEFIVLLPENIISDQNFRDSCQSQLMWDETLHPLNFPANIFEHLTPRPDVDWSMQFHQTDFLNRFHI
jgi:hypothetical protein